MCSIPLVDQILSGAALAAATWKGTNQESCLKLIWSTPSDHSRCESWMSVFLVHQPGKSSNQIFMSKANRTVKWTFFSQALPSSSFSLSIFYVNQQWLFVVMVIFGYFSLFDWSLAIIFLIYDIIFATCGITLWMNICHQNDKCRVWNKQILSGTF